MPKKLKIGRFFTKKFNENKKSLRRNVEKQNVVNDIFMSRLINSRLKLQVCDG